MITHFRLKKAKTFHDISVTLPLGTEIVEASGLQKSFLLFELRITTCPLLETYNCS